jgi:hypothetical protein
MYEAYYVKDLDWREKNDTLTYFAFGRLDGYACFSAAS